MSLWRCPAQAGQDFSPSDPPSVQKVGEISPDYDESGIEDLKKEFWACLALKHAKGIGPRTWNGLLLEYGSAYAAVMDRARWTAKGLAGKKQALEFGREEWRTPAREEWDKAMAPGAGVLCWADKRYPERLRQIADPPLFLYYKGDLGLLRNPGLAMVGSRKASRYGLDATRAIGEDLSRAGITIVSGMACGVDREAHLAGLSGPGSSIAVLGAGIDVDYPSSNRDLRRRLVKEGLILTEFGPGVHPGPRNFPVRNRIISGLSLGVVVTEAARPSGSLITARLAMEQNREVFAVTGPRDKPSYAGCFELIRQGARLVCTAEDVLLELAPLLGSEIKISMSKKEEGGPSRAPSGSEGGADKDGGRARPLPSGLGPDEKLAFETLALRGELHIDELGELFDNDPARTSLVLVSLEMRGLVRQSPGMLYRALES